MRIKSITTKFNSQKGITAADAVLAMLIILTTLGVIVMTYSNLVISSREVDRKAGATRIATNVIENMSQYYFGEIKTGLAGQSPNESNEYTITGSDETKIYGTSIPNGYRLKIKFEDISGVEDLASKCTVTVEYNVNDDTQKVELSKVFSRELSRECNSPNFDDEYLEAASITAKLYANNGTTASYYICPVQFDGSVYKIIPKEDLYDGKLQKIWYSYSDRQWARILVLDQADVNKCTGNNPIENSQYISTFLRDSEKSYVWIPRYGVQKDTAKVYFKYQDTDNAILTSVDNKFFYYMDTNNSVQFSTNYSGIDFEDKKGKWVNYDEFKLKNLNSHGENNEIYWLNKSAQYGPLVEY